MSRHFELVLNYKADADKFTVDAIDVIVADNFTSLLAQFMILISQIHNRILDEERIKNRPAIDDDIPF